MARQFPSDKPARGDDVVIVPDRRHIRAFAVRRCGRRDSVPAYREPLSGYGVLHYRGVACPENVYPPAAWLAGYWLGRLRRPRGVKKGLPRLRWVTCSTWAVSMSMSTVRSLWTMDFGPMLHPVGTATCRRID